MQKQKQSRDSNLNLNQSSTRLSPPKSNAIALISITISISLNPPIQEKARITYTFKPSTGTSFLLSPNAPPNLTHTLINKRQAKLLYAPPAGREEERVTCYVCLPKYLLLPLSPQRWVRWVMARLRGCFCRFVLSLPACRG